MEVRGKRNVYHESKYMCDLCEDDGIITRAKRRRISKNCTLVHEAVPTAGLDESEKFEKCKQHLNEIITLYCPRHEHVGCGDCMILEHKSCQVEHIRDKAKAVKDSREFQESVKDAEECQTEAKKVSIAIEYNKKKATDIKDKFIQDVQNFSDDIMSKINDLKDSVIQQAESMKTQDIESLNKLEKENEEFLNQMTVFTAHFESQIDQPNKLFVSYVQQKANLKRLQESYESIWKKNSIKNYQFTPDGSLGRAVKECRELGSLEVVEQEADDKDMTDRVVSKASALSKQVVAPTQKKRLIERQCLRSNIEIDGEHLSYDGKGTDVGLYFYEPGSLNSVYFEVEILNKGHRGGIVIGVVPGCYPLNCQPGLRVWSVGYNTNDGKLYQESRRGKRFGPKCNTGDIIGCYCQCVIDTRLSWKVSFTRNGKQIGETPSHVNYTYGLCPAIGLSSRGEKVKVILDARRPTF